MCFEGILRRLVTGCSWDVAARISGAGETTLRRRRTEWNAAGVFERLRVEALAAYDKVVGLDLSEIAIDGSQHKALFGGEGTGPNPTDRAKSGWKWSISTDRSGIPLTGRSTAPTATTWHCSARPSTRSPRPASPPTSRPCTSTRATTTRAPWPALTAEAGITDLVCAKRRKKGDAKTTPHKNGAHTLGLRWPVERTNSWFSNFGQLRRNTDRFTSHRLAQIDLAVGLILTVKLIKWAD